MIKSLREEGPNTGPGVSLVGEKTTFAKGHTWINHRYQYKCPTGKEGITVPSGESYWLICRLSRGRAYPRRNLAFAE